MPDPSARRAATVAAIETVGLTKSYGAHRGIEDVDLVVEPGQVVGFLGPNGAGKTTCMRTLLGLLRPTAGSARVLGLDIVTGSLEIRRRVGYLAGDLALHQRLTAREHLAWLAALRGGRGGDRIEPLAERLGLDLGRVIGDLSTGNRQKVGLVQAFMHEPELLVLDEPTRGLDPLVQRTFHEMVAEVAAAGRTVFLSSHVIDEVSRSCERVAILREGRLLDLDTVDTIRDRAPRRVRIRFDAVVDPDELRRLPGVLEVAVDDDGCGLLVTTTGAIDPVVKAAARHTVVDLVAERPDLEDVFLTMYGDGDR